MATKKRGRPKIGDPDKIRFHDGPRAKVAAYAQREGIAFAEAVRRLVDAGLQATGEAGED